jgi:2-polyprenyl-6-hydroxyphenyl methylase/3-demethylubiquinone-9 3-methyltransferase
MALLARNRMSVLDRVGIVYHPLEDAWKRSPDLGVNYMVLAGKDA